MNLYGTTHLLLAFALPAVLRYFFLFGKVFLEQLLTLRSAAFVAVGLCFWSCGRLRVDKNSNFLILLSLLVNPVLQTREQ